jgi:glycosyltransferase involved in cell wall biosynthesis
MRIIQLIVAPQYRGAEIFASQLAVELKKNGHEVLYVSLFQPKSKKYSPAGLTVIDLNAHPALFVNLGLVFKLKKIIEDFRPDLIQANAGDTLKYAVLTRILCNFSFRLVFRNASVAGKYISDFKKKMLYRWFYNSADFIISVSEESRKDLISLYPSCEEKIVVIPNGTLFKPICPVEEIESAAFSLVHVGGFTYEKNHEGLIRIFASIKNKKPEVKLWLVGDGPLQGQIMDLANSKGLNDFIFFKGAVLNPLDYIATADVLLLPSHIEGLPAVILEAFYCKTVVVAYDVGGINEVVKDGITGWLVCVNDENTFVDRVLHVIENHSLSQNITQNAFELASEQYNIELIVSRFNQVYAKLIS